MPRWDRLNDCVPQGPIRHRCSNYRRTLSDRSPLLVAFVFLFSSADVAAAVHSPSDEREERFADSVRPELSLDSLTLADSAHRLDPVRLSIVGGLSAGAFLAGHVFLSDLWWKGEPAPFHAEWRRDWHYALGADKLGHFYTPYVGVDLYRRAFEWTGFDSATSLWIAGGAAFAYMTYIEIRDGFSAEWGFSWGDFAANSFGVGWRVAEHYEPWLGHLRWKIGFYPSERFKAGAYGAIIDDYESTYHWLCLDVDAVLPETWRSAWPDLIDIAIGHSVKGIDFNGAGEHEIYLALDWDLEALPGDGTFWRFLKRTLNYYHLPSPAVRIAPDLIWYGLRF